MCVCVCYMDVCVYNTFLNKACDCREKRKAQPPKGT